MENPKANRRWGKREKKKRGVAQQGAFNERSLFFCPELNVKFSLRYFSHKKDKSWIEYINKI